MKIVKLEDFHADGGWDTYSFLKITTDGGVTGWSEFNESRRKGMTALIHGLGATLIGEDPCAIARIDAALYARSRSTAGGLTSHAIAAIGMPASTSAARRSGFRSTSFSAAPCATACRFIGPAAGSCARAAPSSSTAR